MKNFNPEIYKKTNIQFDLWDTKKESCYMKNPTRIADNQCCCNCVHHFEVFKHCCHSEGEPCVCGESLEFYVCVGMGVVDGKDYANISGKHGMCEAWMPRKRRS
jgi:hypothetical protein